MRYIAPDTLSRERHVRPAAEQADEPSDHPADQHEEVTAVDRYRVIIWGPGVLGSANLKALLGRPEFEIVGVLAFSREKDGVDAGELVGLPPCGVRATTDKEVVHALDADVVLVSLRDALDHCEMDDDVVRMLSSGKNVISSTSYFYPPGRGENYAERLHAACVAGGASLHGTGEHPAMMCERIALTLTGFVTELDHLLVQEYADLTYLANASMLGAAGFGAPPESISSSSPAMEVWGVLRREMIAFMAWKFYDAAPDRVTYETTATCEVASGDVVIPDLLTIPAGTALSIKQRHRGFIDGRRFMTTEEYWFLGSDQCPIEEMAGSSHHKITVEGRPASVSAAIDATASFAQGLLFRDGDTTLPIYNLAVAAMVQAIPMVVAADPGFVYQDALTHYADDLRRLARPTRPVAVVSAT